MSTDNPLLDYFESNTGLQIHKWTHYFDVYHRHLQGFRNTDCRLVEIGMQNGGSTLMWKHYLGPSAGITGIDIDPSCKILEASGVEVVIGDQGDASFWRAFIETHPQINAVIDDGGHTMQQQLMTFRCLFPLLADGGVYICEDTHTSYVPSFGGGLRRDGTFHEFVKTLIDEMHAWYYVDTGIEKLQSPHSLAAIHVYDSIVVFEKRAREKPKTRVTGGQGHAKTPSIDSDMILNLVRAQGGAVQH